MNLVHLTPPHGTVWELLIAAAVVLVGPLVMERFRIPGLIGLLVGGMVIGPHVLGIVPPSGGIVKDLGAVGLVYLMFMAGLELDLAVFAQHRNRAIVFAIVTFAFPFAFGITAGLGASMGTAAAVLLGSLLASHTLITYPQIKRMGLAAKPAVAIAVGATVLTDTIALVVLAVVSGQATSDVSGGELAVQVGLGLAVLGIFCFVLLPPLTRFWFATFGRQQTLRYTYALGVLLAGATVAEVVHIEPIVGAFFTGLALNRLVPNEGEFMERIEFFGSALLIPIFLVSVGTVIDPAVVIDPATLGLAGLFIVACLGGKYLAAAVCKPAYHFSWAEVGVMFSLSASQTAATLAATFVGLDIGLFDLSVVNAVMILILVSLLAASLAAKQFGPRVSPPPVDLGRLGRDVLVPVSTTEPVSAAVRLAARLATADGGLVRPLVVVTPGTEPPRLDELEHAGQAIGALGLEAPIDVRHDETEAGGVAHAARSHNSSVALVTATERAWLPTSSTATSELVEACPSPVVLVRPGGGELDRIVLALGSAQAARPGPAAHLAVALAGRLRASGLDLVVITATAPPADLLTPLQTPIIEVVDPIEWAAQALPTDVVIVPGGRNGSAATARTVTALEARGATILAIADRNALSLATSAADNLGVVTA
ncbi:MAG TPA: cation:proton antiporter [Pseudonocardia sp.]